MELGRLVSSINPDYIWFLEPKASNEHFYSLAAILGYTYSVVFPSFDLAGGYAFYFEQGISFYIVEINANLVAIEFKGMQGQLDKWLACFVYTVLE